MIRPVTAILCLFVIISLVAITLYFTIRQPSDDADHETTKENEGSTSKPSQKDIRSNEPEKKKPDENPRDKESVDDQTSNGGLNKVVDEQKVEKFKNNVKSATPSLSAPWDWKGCQPYVIADDHDLFTKLATDFPSHIEDNSAITDLTELACGLLCLYKNNDETEKYKICVEKIINYIYSTVFQNFNPQNFTNKDYYYALCYARIFILYACYTEKNETGNLFKDKCHPVIVKLLPKFNHIVKKQYDDINVLWINTTRLLTNYLCDKEQYDKDVASDEMKTFRSFVESEKLTNHDSDGYYSGIEYGFYLKLYDAIIESLK